MSNCFLFFLRYHQNVAFLFLISIEKWKSCLSLQRREVPKHTAICIFAEANMESHFKFVFTEQSNEKIPARVCCTSKILNKVTESGAQFSIALNFKVFFGGHWLGKIDCKTKQCPSSNTYIMLSFCRAPVLEVTVESVKTLPSLLPCCTVACCYPWWW